MNALVLSDSGISGPIVLIGVWFFIYAIYHEWRKQTARKRVASAQTLGMDAAVCKTCEGIGEESGKVCRDCGGSGMLTANGSSSQLDTSNYFDRQIAEIDARVVGSDMPDWQKLVWRQGIRSAYRQMESDARMDRALRIIFIVGLIVVGAGGIGLLCWKYL